MVNNNVSTLNIGNDSHQNQLKMEMVAMKQCGDPTLCYCGRCVDFKKPCDMFKTPPCGHTICNYCMHEHVSLNLRENVIHMPCPFKDCEVLLKPKAFKSILPVKVIRRWEYVFFELEMINKVHFVESNKKHKKSAE